MKGFAYFLPGPPDPVTRKRVDEAGLGYLLDGPEGAPAYAPTTAGPGEVAGVVFVVPGRRGAAHPSLPEKPAWTKIHGTQAWLAPIVGGAPGPEELERRSLIDGHEVELGDGRLWRVPVARLLGGGTRLPRALNWDGAAWHEGDVRPLYRDLWAAALRIWDTLAGAQGTAVTLDEEATTSVLALACNYRVGPTEVSALGLLDTRSEVEVLKALVDLPAVEALRGKVEAAGPS